MRPLSSCKVSHENWGHGKVNIRELMGWRKSHQWKLHGLGFLSRTCLESGEVHEGKSGEAGTTESLSHEQLRSTDDKHLQANITRSTIWRDFENNGRFSWRLAFLQMTLDIQSLWVSLHLSVSNVSQCNLIKMSESAYWESNLFLTSSAI